MISVVIPVYKNKKQLIDNLNHNLPFMNQCEIIVVNDDPSSNLRDIKGNFSRGDIIFIDNKYNLGFAGAADEGIKHSNNRYIMLLNSDVLLHDTSYLSALSKIRDEKDLFAVSFSQEEKDNTVVGKNTICWNNGFFQHKKAGDLKAGINGWAEGGACIIDKKKYEEVGRFDRLYSPYYWEDVDLSYRAWKSGYRIVFDPKVKVEHHHESTIKKYFSDSTIRTIAYRNQFIFIWKNINSKKLLLSHVAHLVKYLPGMIFSDRAFIAGLGKAFLQLPAVLRKRKKYPMSDLQILNKFI